MGCNFLMFGSRVPCSGVIVVARGSLFESVRHSVSTLRVFHRRRQCTKCLRYGLRDGSETCESRRMPDRLTGVMRRAAKTLRRSSQNESKKYEV
ncbi:uncharacterized protein DS421_10g291110 [Arachis hypogaea]|nr:uncharacterized protein DS421_10g291110 [Arachis hypogaea]